MLKSLLVIAGKAQTTVCVIAREQSDHGDLPSLPSSRGSEAATPIRLLSRHREGAKRPRRSAFFSVIAKEQSNRGDLPFSSVIAREQSDRGDLPSFSVIAREQSDRGDLPFSSVIAQSATISKAFLDTINRSQVKFFYRGGTNASQQTETEIS